METYFCRLNAPRATFGQDMTAEEMNLMRQHNVHWRQSDVWPGVMAFGVVGDPAGVFGIAVVEANDRARLQAVLDGDPVIRSGRGFRWDLFPMPVGARP
jgi:hypothetical protein